jgi:hypothetical protein
MMLILHRRHSSGLRDGSSMMMLFICSCRNNN